MTAGLYRTADPLQDLDAEIDFKGLQRGWTSPEAEIHLVVRSHGPVVMEMKVTSSRSRISTMSLLGAVRISRRLLTPRTKEVRRHST